MHSPYDILQSILNDPTIFVDNPKGETLKEYISEESILAIEHNMDFFSKIPKNDLQKVIEDFIELVYYYESDLGMYSMDTERLMRSFMSIMPNNNIDQSGNNLIKRIQYKDKKIPAKLKADDLKILKQYQEMLSRLFPLQACNYPRVYIGNKDKDISIIYNINQKLINDLEDENFNIINKDNYHKKQAPTKTKMKKYLQYIRNKYNLVGVSIEEKQLIDTLKSSTNRTLPTID